jgi:hypothetical protein
VGSPAVGAGRQTAILNATRRSTRPVGHQNTLDRRPDVLAEAIGVLGTGSDIPVALARIRLAICGLSFEVIMCHTQLICQQARSW